MRHPAQVVKKGSIHLFFMIHMQGLYLCVRSVSHCLAVCYYSLYLLIETARYVLIQTLAKILIDCVTLTNDL